MPTMSAANRGDKQAGGEGARRAWCHFWFTTFGAWLRGDERGFRDHDHRVHSSGDYQHPPDRREHAALRAWTVAHMHKPPVRLARELRATAGRVLVEKLRSEGTEVMVLAVAAEHVHGVLLCRAAETRAMIGNAKRAASHALRDAVPGALWARRCGLRTITTDEQHASVYDYVVAHVREGAWVWCCRGGELTGERE